MSDILTVTARERHGKSSFTERSLWMSASTSFVIWLVLGPWRRRVLLRSST